MKKRGQFFIIGAVILGIIILSVATLWNATVRDKENVARKKFQALCNNYKHEVFEVSKYALVSNNKSGEEDYIKNFTIKFLQDTRTNEPNFSLLYVYGDNKKVSIFNATNSAVTVESESPNWNSLNGYSYATLTNKDSLKVTIENNKINKFYNLYKDDRFYFIALEEKDGEQFVCE
ncbi:MAG: hypothetical protein ACPLXC_01385 [Candidatus Pacearchaeota archaeon]